MNSTVTVVVFVVERRGSAEGGGEGRRRLGARGRGVERSLSCDWGKDRGVSDGSFIHDGGKPVYIHSPSTRPTEWMRVSRVFVCGSESLSRGKVAGTGRRSSMLTTARYLSGRGQMGERGISWLRLGWFLRLEVFYMYMVYSMGVPPWSPSKSIIRHGTRWSYGSVWWMLAPPPHDVRGGWTIRTDHNGTTSNRLDIQNSSLLKVFVPIITQLGLRSSILEPQGNAVRRVWAMWTKDDPG